jgi:hydroxymethylpyrimidine/phosphomethylpyrimidine kinase
MSIHAPPTVLTFSASDPTGAGGVLADALTCASMGCHAACAITAVAVQDSTRVEDALLIDDEWLDDQARAVLQDMPVAAIKVGAVGGSDNAQAIAEILADYPELPVVFDPLPAVRASSSGSEEQADAELMTVLRELIVPQATVMTLSLEQARRWLALAAEDDAPEDWDAARCARELLDWGAEHVLITSAETVGNLIVNRLFGPDNSVQSESIEHVDLRFRGAGDTLSAAIAALLAQGIEVGDAVREANEFLSQSLAGGFRLGMGDAMPDRLFWASDDGSDDAAAEAVAGANDAAANDEPPPAARD